MITAHISYSHTDGALLLTNVKVDGKAINRNHINIRMQDLVNASVNITSNHVVIKGQLSSYNHFGTWKSCITNVTSIKSI